MPEPGIRLIALDLDGTLLNSAKQLTPRSRAALAAAAAAGIEVVPATGRLYIGMPQAVKELEFVRYVITVNGAGVYDVQAGRELTSILIPADEALDIMAYLDTLPLIYDCYMDGEAWMTRALWERCEDFAPDEHYRKMLRQLRQPVPELKAFVRERGSDVQKIQLFTKDMQLRARLLRELGERFPALAVSSSVVNNIEINHADANKGAAIRMLARHLGLRPEQTMAFGDGLNDIFMLQAAGTGVAMGNAAPEVKAAADTVTGSCDEDGIRAMIESIL